MEENKLRLNIDCLIKEREKFRQDLEAMLGKEVKIEDVIVLYDNKTAKYDFVHEQWTCKDQLIIKRIGQPTSSIDTIVQFNSKTYKLPTFINNKNK